MLQLERRIGMRLAAVMLFLTLLPTPAGARERKCETVMWGYVDFQELRENAKVWHDIKGMDGFIFCHVNGKGAPRWYAGPEMVAGIYEELPETVAALRKAGIEANFVHAGVDNKDWHWFNDDLLKKVVPTFCQLAKMAKETKCRGVALDCEAYSCEGTFWNPRGYKEEQLPEVKRRIRQMGADIAGVILEEFPDAEIMLLPEGAYVAAIGTPDHPQYDLWVEFYRGLESKKPPGGIHIFCSGSYLSTDPLWLHQLHGRVWGNMLGVADDLIYFKRHCTVNLTAWLQLDQQGPQYLARLDDPKTLEAVERQFRTMRKLSPHGYAFIFAHVAGLYNIPPDRKGPEQMHGSLAPNADEYFNILRSR